MMDFLFYLKSTIFRKSKQNIPMKSIIFLFINGNSKLKLGTHIIFPSRVRLFINIRWCLVFFFYLMLNIIFVLNSV